MSAPDRPSRRSARALASDRRRGTDAWSVSLKEWNLGNAEQEYSRPWQEPSFSSSSRPSWLGPRTRTSRIQRPYQISIGKQASGSPASPHLLQPGWRARRSMSFSASRGQGSAARVRSAPCYRAHASDALYMTLGDVREQVARCYTIAVKRSYVSCSLYFQPRRGGGAFSSARCALARIRRSPRNPFRASSISRPVLTVSRALLPPIPPKPRLRGEALETGGA